MNFAFTQEQTMLRDMLGAFLRDHYDFAARRAILASEAGMSADIWRAFAQKLGILGAPFPAHLGGVGGGAIELMLIMEEMGRHLVLEPFLPTVVLAGDILQRSGHDDTAALTAAVIAGEMRIAVAYAEPGARYSLAHHQTSAMRDDAGWVLNGHKTAVMGGPWASRYIVAARTSGQFRDRDGISLFLVDSTAKGLLAYPYPTIDGLRASDIYLKNVSVPPTALLGEEGAGLALLEHAVDAGTLALCAEAVGAMRALLAMTIDYTRQRTQFGAPIASFQVLQHRMVDMFIAVEQSAAITHLATRQMDAAEALRERMVSAAKVQVATACRLLGENAVQLHGGMGMTDELPVGHYFKRLTAVQTLLGSSDHHLSRYQRLAFADAA